MKILPSLKISRKEPKNYSEGELDFCRAEFEYCTYDVNEILFSNAYLTFDGVIYSTKWEIYVDTIVPFYKIKKINTIKRYLFTKKREYANKPCVVCFDAWSSNHYHWIVDFLPRLLCAKKYFTTHIILLPDTPYVRNTGMKILEAVGLLPSSFDWISYKDVVKLKEFIYIEKTVISGRSHDFFLQEIKSFFIKTSPLIPVIPFRKIYISREKANYRKVLNEQDVQQLFKKFGYEIIIFEELDIMKQIEIAYQSAVLVSIHGAGLTNCFFMQESGSVVEFRRNQIYQNQCYWHLAEAMKQDYYYFFGEPDSPAFIEGVDCCNLYISIPKMERLLQEIEQNLVKKVK